ncbi:hypothetical protein A1O3_05395 [Capronia epimyces CBS 606.96]|uniref:Alpha/beta hydrolase fold-3 domain-containing protein n=1 Tax=Capronia epimyces CBS 606.96 TaxID=1182542 RepID=W9YR24_9EURO|nr:uncharacterized protein A1O3_05395 [Capronia epimyces CBS 606.96]EXJ84724.1 hypothetical protein A1O3_05395 [Capronia epimyces CBS 606.96]
MREDNTARLTLSDAELSNTIYQPLHPDVRPHLDPEYVAFHDRYLQYVEPDDVRPWDSVGTRQRVPFPPGTSAPVPVRAVKDIELANCTVRAFWPSESDEGRRRRPVAGWPVLVWYHGGGWAIGGIQSENDFCTRMCSDANCVVVTVGYRLAPEHPYPAAVDDALEALVWVNSEQGRRELDIDNTRIAIGGTSAGGNLSLATSLKASLLQPPIRPIFQLLVVPVIDNTATTATIWASRPHAPWLTPARMTWYRSMYLTNSSDATNWDASPNLAPPELLRNLPPTWMGVAEQDVLAPEALRFADQVRAVRGSGSNSGSGLDVEVELYPGMTHTILAMNGILSKGKKLVNDAGQVLQKAFTRDTAMTSEPSSATQTPS